MQIDSDNIECKVSFAILSAMCISNIEAILVGSSPPYVPTIFESTPLLVSNHILVIIIMI